MKCVTQRCPDEMQDRQIIHTFIRDGNPIIVEDLPALVCPMCGCTLLDLHVLDTLFAFDPETAQPVRQAPVFRVSLAPAA